MTVHVHVHVIIVIINHQSCVVLTFATSVPVVCPGYVHLVMYTSTVLGLVDGLLLEGGVVADLGPLGVGQGHNLPHGHCG